MTRALLLLLALGVVGPAPAVASEAGVGAACKRTRKARKPRKRRKRRPGRRAPKAAAAPASAAASAPPQNTPAPSLRRSNRMDFDARLVKGEKASGAVYLFRRVPRQFTPLLQLKQAPLDRIVRPVLHRGVDAPKAGETP